MTGGNRTISNDEKLCRIFNNSFPKTVDELKIPNISNYKHYNTIDPLKEPLKYFENHTSIKNIESKGFDASFTFRNTSSSEFITSQRTDIPTKIVQLNSDFFENCICKNFNNCLENSEFPCILKHVDLYQ